MSSLDRLIDLAKKTGDRLIIHDPVEGNDMVVMDVDSYEHLVLGRRTVHKLSEGQMLNQINRDISVWRANRDLDEWSDRTSELEEELRNHPLPDPFEEDFTHSSDWHSAGSVIGGMNTPWMDDEDDDEDGEGEITKLRNYDIGDGLGDIVPVDEEISLEDLRPIPLRGEDETGREIETEALPGQDPVFYEEPV